jgi:hypothetical protein
VCLCDFTLNTGYWTGDACDGCAAGYFGANCDYETSTLNQAPSLQSRYGGQSNQSTNTYLIFQPALAASGALPALPSMLLAGGPAFHATFATGSSDTKLLAVSDAAGTSPYCETADLRAWVINRRMYLFGARGGCFDVQQLFAGPADTLPADPPGFSSLIATPHTRYGNVDMGSVGGKVALCYTSVAADESEGRPSLICYCADPLTSPPRFSRFPLLSMVTVSTVTINAPRAEIIVGGLNQAGGCVVQIVRIDVSVFSLADAADSGTSTVTLSGTCINVGCATVGPHGVVVLGATTTTGVAIYGFRVADAARTVTVTNFNYTSATCSDVILDGTGKVGVAAFKQREDSRLVKLRVGDPSDSRSIVPYGEQFFGSVPIARLAVDDSTRIVYGLAQKSDGVVVFRWLLLDTTAITPAYADLRAGTVVTVVGRGFYTGDDLQAFCSFGGAQLGPAVVVNENAALCIAPSAELQNGCGGQVVELTLNGWAYTSNNQEVIRVTPPTVTGAQPPEVFIDSPVRDTVVTLFGLNFVPTANPQCRFTDGVDVVVAPAAFVDGASVTCNMSRAKLLPLYDNATVDVALDSGQYTGTGLPFVIIGAPFTVRPDPPMVSNQSSATTGLRQRVKIALVDVRGNIVRETRYALARTVDAVFSGVSFTLQTSSDFEADLGYAELVVPDMRYPAVGDYVYSATFGPWSTTFIVTIVQGDLAALKIVKQPPPTMYANERLTNSTVVQLYDVSGNAWRPTTPKQISCVLIDMGGTELQPFPDQPASIDGDAAFDRLEIDTSLGVQLRLRFAVRDDPVIPPTESAVIRVNCLSTQFQYTDAKSGLLSCRTCSDGAICDGSPEVRIQPGFWMGNLSAPVVYACPIEEACTGGQGTCGEGYAGPLCGACAGGYGKNQDGLCQGCGDDWVAPFIVAITVTAMLASAAIAILVIIQHCRNPTNLMIIVALFMNFGQTFAAFKYLNADWAFTLRSTFSWAAVITDYQMHSVSSDCVLRKGSSTYLDKAVFYYAAMLVTPMLAVLVRVVLRVRPTLFLSSTRSTAVRADIALGEVPEEQHTFAVVATTVQVYLFITYQATVTHALRVFRCKTVVFGEDLLNLMEEDLTVSCDSAEYSAAKTTAVVVLVLYGFFIPACQMIATAFTISKFRASKKEQDAQMYLPLILLGLRPEVWYWHSVILLKKFLLVFVIIFNDRPLNSFLALWVLNAYLMFMWVVRPFVNEGHNFLELFATFSAVLTVNTGLLNMAGPWPALRIAVVVLVLVYMATVVGMFVMNAYEPVQQLILRYLYRDVIQANLQRLKKRRKRQGIATAHEEDAAAGGIAAIMDQIERESVDSEDERLQQLYLARRHELAEDEDAMHKPQRGPQRGSPSSPMSSSTIVPVSPTSPRRAPRRMGAPTAVDPFLSSDDDDRGDSFGRPRPAEPARMAPVLPPRRVQR